MKREIIRHILACILMLGLAIPGAAIAGGKGCQLQGTWFGVASPQDLTLTGWMVTVAGKSADHGTNNLEFPTNHPSLFGLYPDATRASTLRGAWERTGGNTFTYKMIGIGVDDLGLPIYAATLSGAITLSADCKSEHITATIEAFDAGISPFYGNPTHVLQLPDHYGYRVSSD